MVCQFAFVNDTAMQTVTAQIANKSPVVATCSFAIEFVPAWFATTSDICFAVAFDDAHLATYAGEQGMSSKLNHIDAA